MKRIFTLTFILLASTSFVSCSKQAKDRPDKIYSDTIGNPALGANSSLGSTTPPISDGISSSLDLFGSKKEKIVKKDGDRTIIGSSQARSHLKIPEEQIAEATVTTSEVKNDIALVETTITEDKQIAETVVETPKPAEVKPTLVRAPRIPVSKINVDEKSDKPLVVATNVNAPAPKEPANTTSLIAPVTTETKPVNGLRILSMEELVASSQPSENITVQPKAEAQEAKLADNNLAEIKEEVVEEKLPIVQSKQADRMPASMAYKLNNRTETPKEEKSDSGVFSLFSSSKDSSENNDKVEVTEQKLDLIDATSDLPPVDSANVGQCYSKATMFGETKDVEEKILIKDGYQKTVDVPAEYKEVEEEIVIKEASTKMVNIPTTYKEVEEEVIVSPEHTEEVVITPAKYDVVTEKTLVHPAQKKWIKDGNSEIMKLVEIPEEYKDITKKVLVSEAVTEKRTVPAITKFVKKKVIDQEARVEKQTVPAVTKTIKKQVLVHDASTETIDVPAEYKTVKKKIQVSADKLVWLPVMCKDKLSKDKVKRIQGALIAKGYDIKNADGSLGNQTLAAVDEFQRSLGFKSEGVALKALESLGIDQ